MAYAFQRGLPRPHHWLLAFFYFFGPARTKAHATSPMKSPTPPNQTLQRTAPPVAELGGRSRLMNEYAPEKWIWTDADFDQMGWHDVVIHAVAFSTYTLSLDIDYMFRWVDPAPGETYCRFWLSPATLVFDNVSDLRLDLEPHGAPIIMGVTRSEPITIPDHTTTWRWLFDCLDGEISFRATGYHQFARRAPVLTSAQSFLVAERGGVSFAQVTPESTVA